MLTPVPNSPERNGKGNEVELLIPISPQRAVEIANAHIVKPEYEKTIAWYDVGRNTRFNTEAIRQECGAEEVSVQVSSVRPGQTIFTKFLEFNYYSVQVVNPATLPAHLVAGNQTCPLSTIRVFNAGNIDYAAILFSTREAQVKSEYIPELQRHGFTCWKASDPYEGTREGPCQSIHTLDEAFGPGAREWMEDYLNGTGPEVLIINRP